MWRLTLGLVFAVSTSAIRVPVDNNDANTTSSTQVQREQTKQNKPIYYIDDSRIDSYLIPPDPYRPDNEDILNAPPTHLIPPLPDQRSEYFTSSKIENQSDWYPIAPSDAIPHPIQQKSVVPIYLHNKDSQNIASSIQTPEIIENQRIHLSIPSRQLEPPKIDFEQTAEKLLSQEQQLPVVKSKNNFRVTPPSKQLELPLPEPNQRFNQLTENVPLNFHLAPAEPTLALHLTPPKRLKLIKNPTNLYPKKYRGEFAPIPIPIAQYANEVPVEVLKARPITNFKPEVEDTEHKSLEKKIFQYEQAEQKRKRKQEIKREKYQQELKDVAESNTADNSEQEASETNFVHPGRNSYPAPLRQAPPRVPSPESSNVSPAPKERTEFRMHGMNGPHSYQFGYDTGKGKNRQFRFEERDNDGRVKGHYGYMDRSGKLRVVNYNADPEHGFHADAPTESK